MKKLMLLLLLVGMLIGAGCGKVKNTKAKETVYTEPIESEPKATKVDPAVWEGFRDFKWKITTEQIDEADKYLLNAEEKSPDGRLVFYSRYPEKMYVGNARLERVIYGFYKEEFFSIMISLTGADNFELFKQALWQHYGTPKKKKDELRWVWSPAHTGQKAFAWLEHNKATGETIFGLGNLELQKQSERDDNVCGKIGTQEGVENAKGKLMMLFYEKYKNKYNWYNGKYIELLDYDPNKYAWCYNKTVTPKDPYIYSLTEFDEKVLSALMDFKWRVGEYGLIADKQIFQILNQNEMLVIYGTGLNQEIAHFSGWSTKKMIDGQQWNPGEVVAIIGTYRYTTSIDTVKTIPDVVPAKLFRKGITFEQFKDMLKKNNDLPEELQKAKDKF